MKKFMLVLSLSLAIGTVITLNSCKKTESTVADDSVSAKDNSTISNAFNATTDDAEAAAGLLCDDCLVSDSLIKSNDCWRRLEIVDIACSNQNK